MKYIKRHIIIWIIQNSCNETHNRTHYQNSPDVLLAATPEEALMGASCCFIFTEWAEIKALKPEDFKKYMRTPLVYDGRNIFDPAEMKAAGVEYYSIGR